MSKRHNNVVPLAVRRAAARVKHDARARYERRSATEDLHRRGLLRTSRERARRGDATVYPQYWRFLSQGVRARLEREGWSEPWPLNKMSMSEWLTWNHQRGEAEAAAKIREQQNRRALRSKPLARKAVEDCQADATPAARPEDERAEEGQHRMILRPFNGKVIPSCACGGLRSKAMGESYAKGVYTRHAKAAVQAAAA